MYLEADNIDALDPTFNSNRGKGLGMNSTNGRFYNNSRVYWSSTGYSSTYAWVVHYNGRVANHTQTVDAGVAPVKELSIS